MFEFYFNEGLRHIQTTGNLTQAKIALYNALNYRRDYVPVYLELGNVLIKLREYPAASEVMYAGLSIANWQNNELQRDVDILREDHGKLVTSELTIKIAQRTWDKELSTAKDHANQTKRKLKQALAKIIAHEQELITIKEKLSQSEREKAALLTEINLLRQKPELTKTTETYLAYSEVEISPADCADRETPSFQDYAQSVGLIINKERLTKIKGTYHLCQPVTLNDTVHSRYGKPLASNPFGKQYTEGVGTAFLGTKNTIITAGCCIKNQGMAANISNYCVLFNFHTDKTIFAKSDVYSLTEVIAYRCDQQEDWGVVRLDREVGNVIIPPRSTEPPKANTPLYILGHPCGLPLKIEKGARVTKSINARNPYKFFTSSSALHGNPGSPVFNAKTNQIEGILSPQKEAFEEKIACVSFSTYAPDSIGESCNVISRIEQAFSPATW